MPGGDAFDKASFSMAQRSAMARLGRRDEARRATPRSLLRCRGERQDSTAWPDFSRWTVVVGRHEMAAGSTLQPGRFASPGTATTARSVPTSGLRLWTAQ